MNYPRIKYFIPDWDDRYDPEFDFISDNYSARHQEDTNNDVYAHEMFEQPPYDGILYSLGNLFSSIEKTGDLRNITLRGYSNIKKYYHLDKAKKRLELFGDCGAFNYINLKEPPEKFTPENIAFLYQHLGFDYGVSVDHLVVESIIENINGKKIKRNLTLKEKQYRKKISIDNAERFLKACKEKKYRFQPVGSAQGYSPRTYRDSVAKLVDMGYEYIALGGLVRRRTSFILEIVQKVSPILKGRKLHLLGVVRTQFINELKELGVTSVDSASYFRKAWLRSNQNYIAPDGKTWYAAIRVPIAKESRMKIIKKHIVDLCKLESDCLKALREYDKGKLDLQSTLDIIVEYDSLFLRNGDDGKDLKETYKRTLEARPWKVCNCPICKDIGIEVIIFRRTNRNKRRGLHNTWVLYNNILS